jgi:16S rRNA (guanine527-N7)-methyltransferase
MATTTNAVWLQTVCVQNGLQLTDKQLNTLEQFGNLLLDWNKKINLISRRDEENFWTSHILHSLSVLFKVSIPLQSLILDLGTGGGLPGIPMKIVRPDLRFTLVDSTQKKINVVKEISRALGLHGIDTVWGRAEDVGKQKEHARCYDVIVARAVAPLKDLVLWSMPFLKREVDATPVARGSVGDALVKIARPTLVALKGGNLSEELRAIEKNPRVTSISVLDLSLKGSTQLAEGDKKIVLVEFTTGQTQKAEES